MSTVLSDEEIVKYLLFQQFYYGGNLIYGRTREVSVKIKGSGPIIERFYNCLISDIDLI
ncbi:MAG: hypothetical protein GY870_03680, partial [archaeon]|nr:hypothetical protein [archaeon]